MNIPFRGEQLRKIDNLINELKVVPTTPASLKVNVYPGLFWRDSILVDFTGGLTPVIELPEAKFYRLSVVAINSKNEIIVINGVDSIDAPIAPDVPSDILPLAFIHLSHSTNRIITSIIYDVRPFINIDTKSTNNTLVTKDTIGLNNIDNTSDIDKPVSKSMQTALNLKVNITSLKSAAGANIEDFISSSDATNRIIIKDKKNPNNKYKIEIIDGVLTATVI